MVRSHAGSEQTARGAESRQKPQYRRERSNGATKDKTVRTNSVLPMRAPQDNPFRLLPSKPDYH